MFTRIARFCLFVLLALTLLPPASPAAPVLAQDSSPDRSYLPMVMLSRPVYFKPGLYPFSGKCDSTELDIDGQDIGKLTECVPSVQINTDGTVRVNFTWKLDIRPDIYQCVTKYSDVDNWAMYLLDNTEQTYWMIDAGGAADIIYCMEDNKLYEGWFLFPPATSSDATSYYFFDGDNGFRMGPLDLPKNPNP